MTVNVTKAKQIILLGGLMLLDGKVAPVSVAFLLRSYQALSDIDSNARGLTVKQMSDNYGCRPQSGIKHVKHLARNDVLIRTEHKRWKFNWDHLIRLNNLDQIDI